MTKIKGNQLIKGQPIKVLTTASIATLMLGTGVASNYVNAQPINESDKVVTTPNNNETVPEGYDTIAQFTKNTKLETTGATFVNTDKNKNASDKSQKGKTIHSPKDSLKGKIGAKYTNVATVDGKKIDLKITINDWDRYLADKDKDGKEILTAMSFGRDAITFDQSGYNWVDMTWEYVDKDGKPVDVKGTFMSILDVDTSQYVEFDKDTTKRIKKLYADKSSWLDFEEKDGKIKISEKNDEISNDDDEFAQFTSLFEGSKVNFKWGRDFSIVEAQRDGSDSRVPMTPQYNKFVPDKTYGANEHFVYSAKKPVKTESQTPVKTVTDEDEKIVKENTLKDSKEVYEYDITHRVPDEKPEFYKTNYSFEDTVIDELSIDGKVKVTDENGNDVTSKFEDKSEGNKVKLEAKADELKKADFYGHDYKFSFKTKIKDGADLSKYLKDGEYDLPNNALVTVDNEKKQTNDTHTKVKEQDPEAKKEVLTADKKPLTDNIEPGEDYKYRLDFKTPVGKPYKDITIKDNLEDVLEFKNTKDNVKIYDEDDKDITEQGEFTKGEDDNSFAWKVKDPSKFVDKSFYAVIDTKVKDDADLTPYAKEDKDGNKVYTIPNKGAMELDGKDVPTNEVEVNINRVDSSVKKSIIEGDKLVEQNESELGKDVNYLLEYTIGNGKAYKSAEFSDDLEDVLDIDKGSIKVYTEKDSESTDSEEQATDSEEQATDSEEQATDEESTDEESTDEESTDEESTDEESTDEESKVPNKDNLEDITKEGDLTVDEDKESFNWKAKDPKSLKGKKVYIEVNGKIKEDADLSKYEKDGKALIPNVSKMKLDEDETESNKVLTGVPEKEDPKEETPKEDPKDPDDGGEGENPPEKEQPKEDTPKEKEQPKEDTPKEKEQPKEEVTKDKEQSKDTPDNKGESQKEIPNTGSKSSVFDRISQSIFNAFK